MVDVAMDLAKYLNANNADFPYITMAADGPNNSTFVNDLPDSPNEAVAFFRYAGRPPTETFDNPFAVRNPRVQVMVRHPKSNIALDRAEAIMKYLSRIKDQTINGTKYQRVKPVGEPAEVGPDSSDRQRATINLEVSFYDV